MRRAPGKAGGFLHLVTDEPRSTDSIDFGRPLDWSEDPLALPRLDAAGDLVLPMNCPRRFRWWSGGQPVSKTLEELAAGTLSLERPPAWKGSVVI